MFKKHQINSQNVFSRAKAAFAKFSLLKNSDQNCLFDHQASLSL
jgi:hypothetical protein